MIEYILQRFDSQKDATLGALFVSSRYPLSFRCFTLEDEARTVKVPGETRIPAGRYEIKFRHEGAFNQKYKDKFPFHKGMLHLQNVPNFEFILIHCGNTDEDTAGCLLVGQSADAGTGTIGKSVAAYAALYAEISAFLLSGESVWIRIEDYA